MAKIDTVFLIGFKRVNGQIYSYCAPHHVSIGAALKGLESQVRLRGGQQFQVCCTAKEQPVITGAHMHPAWLFRRVCRLAEEGAMDLLTAHEQAESTKTSERLERVGDAFSRLVQNAFRGQSGSLTENVKPLLTAPLGPFKDLVEVRMRERAVEITAQRFRHLPDSGVIH